MIRYVNDIFAIINKDFNLGAYVQYIDSQYTTMKFTSEKQKDGE